MAITKGYQSFTWASGSSTTSGTTSPVNISTYIASTVFVSVAQVGTASIAASFTVQVSLDGTNYYNVTTINCYTVAGTYYWAIDIPVVAQYVQIQYSAQTGGTSSTLTAQVGTGS